MKNKIIVILSALVLVFSAQIVIAATGYSFSVPPNGGTYNSTWYAGNYGNESITNYYGLPLFVSTNTYNEYESFINNPPPQVSINGYCTNWCSTDGCIDCQGEDEDGCSC
jgi:hypothetical protein